ncbi:hypothetical protein CCACVL1_12975 [Corchorus capsularis]|uniref:Uncharacterized protein n=1 Tax=Corchorus capsularis TaxID=210143 RepID=A0A1R3ICS6_COCAP|nr:hypothetical protein CCACVL1_12975 [Corchorus capsularis]
MGIWDVISWSTDSVKGLWQSSYDHGCAAMTKMNKVVRVDEAVEKVNQQLSDPETRSKISRVGTNVAKNAAIEGLKAIPGAFPTYKIVAKSLSDDNKSDNENKSKKHEEDLKTLQATVSRLETEVRVLREQAAETQNPAVKTKPQNTVQSHQKPEDNNRVSGMKNFICSHL